MILDPKKPSKKKKKTSQKSINQVLNVYLIGLTNPLFENLFDKVLSEIRKLVVERFFRDSNELWDTYRQKHTILTKSTHVFTTVTSL